MPVRKRPASACTAPPPVRRRLRGKQPAPAYDPPGEEVEAVLRRPAARKRAQQVPSKRCAGYLGQSCVFSTQRVGQQARVNADRVAGAHCVFCSAANLARSLANARGKGLITAALAFFKENDERIFQDARARAASLASDAALAECLARLERLQKRGATKELRGRAARKKKEDREAGAWGRLLQRRKTQQRFSKEQKKEARQAKEKAAQRLSKKFPAVYSMDGAERRPGTYWRSPLAASFKQRAEEHAWSMCQQRSRLVPNKFHPKHLRCRGLQHTITRNPLAQGNRFGSGLCGSVR